MLVTDPAPLPPTTTTTSTTELLHAAATGDAFAWRQLVERFEPTVRSTIIDLRLQPADAHDAAQDTWLRMVEHHHAIREPEALGGWLRTTARRAGLKIIREQGRSEPLDDLERFQDPAVHVEQDVVDTDTVRRVRDLVDLLPPRSATLVHELFQDTPPGYGELARNTGIPVGSIGPTRARAMVKLRRWFEDGAHSGIARRA